MIWFFTHIILRNHKSDADLHLHISGHDIQGHETNSLTSENEALWWDGRGDGILTIQVKKRKEKKTCSRTSHRLIETTVNHNFTLPKCFRASLQFCHQNAVLRGKGQRRSWREHNFKRCASL